jgi:ABC-type glutathione transport system ATPase component
MAVLQGLKQERGITVVLVTHDPVIARHAERILHLHDGEVTHNETVDKPLVATREADRRKTHDELPERRGMARAELSAGGREARRGEGV